MMSPQQSNAPIASRRSMATQALAKYFTGHLVAVHSMGLGMPDGSARKVQAQEFFALRGALDVTGYATATEAQMAILRVLGLVAPVGHLPDGVEARAELDPASEQWVVYWHRDAWETTYSKAVHRQRGFIAGFKDRLPAETFAEAVNTRAFQAVTP